MILKKVRLIYLYFIFVAFFFVQIMNGFNGKNSFSETRMLPIIIILMLGAFLKRNRTYKKFGRCAIFLAVYMSLVAILQIGLSVSVISSIISFSFWVIVLHQVKAMDIKETDLGIISLIMAIACNLSAIIYSFNLIHWQYELENEARVGAVNSIYYILTMLPFIFYLEKWWLSLVMSLMPLSAFVVSGKTTCLLCGGLIVLYNIWQNVSILKWKSKILFFIGLCICIALAINKVDFSIMNSDITEDIESGGNGRSDIAYKVIEMLIQEDNPMLLIFGHGVNSISARLGIGGHNDYLELLFCYGFIGLFLFFAFWKELISSIKMFTTETHLKTGFIVSLIVLFFSTFASKLLATQIGMLSLAIFWGVTYAYNNSKK